MRYVEPKGSYVKDVGAYLKQMHVNTIMVHKENLNAGYHVLHAWRLLMNWNERWMNDAQGSALLSGDMLRDRRA